VVVNAGLPAADGKARFRAGGRLQHRRCRQRLYRCSELVTWHRAPHGRRAAAGTARPMAPKMRRMPIRTT